MLPPVSHDQPALRVQLVTRLAHAMYLAWSLPRLARLRGLL